MTEIKMVDLVGTFAENKDKARSLRINTIIPALNKNQDVILDFDGVDGTTQSFIHALISDIIRKKGINVLDKLFFKNCNSTVKQIIQIVVEYMQVR